MMVRMERETAEVKFGPLRDAWECTVCGAFYCRVDKQRAERQKARDTRVQKVHIWKIADGPIDALIESFIVDGYRVVSMMPLSVLHLQTEAAIIVLER